ncbi:MAG TPA: acyl-CoA dehydrogenase family protein [Polyangiaceae bacterium]|nr:acyl-CoA dehydrogenase family protein [Polyangiaceae bacterium]
MSGATSDLLDRARRAAQQAALHAADVDHHARFPAESLDALRRERLLGVHVSVPLGGEGASLKDLSAICGVLAQSCATTGMIYAMHQIQVGCMVRHAHTPAFDAYLTELVERQRLIASATSEAGIGGDTRRSGCAVEVDGARFRLEKNASVISYGAQTDDILVTARRHPEAVPSDQVLALVKDADVKLEATGGWDTLGMRGTCSLGFKLRAEAPRDQILPEPFADISAQTMVPYSHILWASVWLGIATDAVRRARMTVRNEARKKPGTIPPSASRLAELTLQLHLMRAALRDGIEEYERRMDDPDALASLSFAVRMNNLKLAASEAVVAITSRALLIAGIAGYRNDSELSLGRHLRDAHSASIMISNDRLYATNATLLLAVRED